MAILNRRMRMVSFRLSDKEYNDALLSCSARGIRSVSSLARWAVLNSVPQSGTSASSADRLQAQVDSLTESLARALHLLDLSYAGALKSAVSTSSAATREDCSIQEYQS